MTQRPLLTSRRRGAGQPPQTLPDPARELLRMMTPIVAHSVDELHVAAVMESMGVTDQVAQDTYGQDDVFALAAALYRRLPTMADRAASDGSPVLARSHGTLRVLTHGLLYILPSPVYPAVLIALGASAMIRGLVFTTALGWVWGTGMSAVAYQLVGQDLEQLAGRALRLLGVAGLIFALFSGALLAITGPGAIGVMAFAVAQMGFQLMSGVLVFYGKELRLAVMMLPAFVAGIVLLASGYAASFVVPTLVAGGLSIVLLGVTTWVTSTRAMVLPDASHPVALWRTFAGAVPSVCYAGLCAVFLLLTDSRFVVGDLGLAIAAVPLILGMGTLEWRAHRFTEKAGELFGRATMSAGFRRSAWQLLLRELTYCLAVLSVLGAAVVVMLREFGSLSSQGLMLVAAHVLLGGAFFLGFVMARHRQFARLLGILSIVVVANIVAVIWVAPHGEIPIFLLSSMSLLVLQLVTLRASFRRVAHYASAGFTRSFDTSVSITFGDQKYSLIRKGTHHARRNPRRGPWSTAKALHHRTPKAAGTHRRGVRHPGHHPAAAEDAEIYPGHSRNRTSRLAYSCLRRGRISLGIGRGLLRRGSAIVDHRAAPEFSQPSA
jgi:hypothetical protein